MPQNLPKQPTTSSINIDTTKKGTKRPRSEADTTTPSTSPVRKKPAVDALPPLPQLKTAEVKSLPPQLKTAEGKSPPSKPLVPKLYLHNLNKSPKIKRRMANYDSLTDAQKKDLIKTLDEFEKADKPVKINRTTAETSTQASRISPTPDDASRISQGPDSRIFPPSSSTAPSSLAAATSRSSSPAISIDSLSGTVKLPNLEH